MLPSPPFAVAFPRNGEAEPEVGGLAAVGGSQVSLIPVLSDNYVFVLHGPEPGPAVVVDPAVAEPVIAWLEARGLELVAILHTHHHSDHIGGTPDLLRRWPKAAVIASAADRERIPLQTRGVSGGDQFTLLGRPVQVLAVPGHTRHHIAFYLPPAGLEADGGATGSLSDPPLSGSSAAGGTTAVPRAAGELFCGDALFAAGCGRLFEGTPEQMHASLQRFARLPEATRVWCAHEYTATNLAWAHAQAPADAAIAARLAEVRAIRAAGRPTIPSQIALERRTNLFLRASDPAALAALRASRNVWNG